jgi:hypothetical protein
MRLLSSKNSGQETVMDTNYFMKFSVGRDRRPNLADFLKVGNNYADEDSPVAVDDLID